MYKQVAWRCGEDKLPETQESGPWHRGFHTKSMYKVLQGQVTQWTVSELGRNSGV